MNEMPIRELDAGEQKKQRAGNHVLDNNWHHSKLESKQIVDD